MNETKDMNPIEYAFEGKTVRVCGTAEAPLFCAADVCKALDLENPTRALSGLDEDEKTTITKSKGRAGHGPQSYLVVTESGLYHLIFKSRKEAAKRFRKWVTDEVLPALRKDGSYTLPDVSSLADGEVLTVPQWLAELKLDLVRDATLAELLCARLAKAAAQLRYRDASFRERDGFQRVPRAVLDLALGIFQRDAASPVNKAFFETAPKLA